MNRNSKDKDFGFVFEFPSSWQHGRGIVAQIGKTLRQNNLKRPLLLTDKLLISLGIVSPVIKSLADEGISYQLCDEVDQEPTLTLFNRLCATLELSSFDSIIAVGGGSVIDVAKGLSVIASFGGDIRDYGGFGKVPGVPSIRVIAVPTTSGTGSEVSDGVVIIDELRDTKFLVISKKICPFLALTDPEMTKAMPPRVTACSGVDALVHAIESYLSKGASPITELFSLKAIKLISGAIKSAYHDGSDLNVREQMQIGATMAMISGMNAYLGLCHALAMPLCGLYQMPHGQACGMVLPEVLRFNAVAEKKKVMDVFEVLGFDIDGADSSEQIESGCEKLVSFLNSISIVVDLNAFGFHKDHMNTIVKESLGSAQNATNPRVATEADIEKIIRAMV